MSRAGVAGPADRWPAAGMSRRAAVSLAAMGAIGTAGLAAVRSGPQPGPVLTEELPPLAAAGLAGTRPVGLPLAGQALADLVALQGPFPLVVDGDRSLSPGIPGAAIAAWASPWRYVWPRDASFIATALSTAGFTGRAAAVLDFLAGISPADGRWAARYLPDGSGRVPDRRGVEADGGGWVCWAVWAHVTRNGGASRAGRWWSVVEASAQELAGSLDRFGQAPASPDHWETATDRVTLETMAAYLVGLRSAAALARGIGRTEESTRWAVAAQRVAAVLIDRWAPPGYPRSLPHGGADAAVGLLASLAPDLPRVAAAAAETGRSLRLPNGGISPGTAWKHDRGIAWTPEVAMLALGSARSDPAGATAHLRWLESHRSPDGHLPEKVLSDGSPASVAPLGWTCALALLSASALDGTAGPVPPAGPVDELA